MSNSFNRSGFEESILYSNDDYEPYGYVSPQLASGSQAAGYAGSRPYEREIEAAVLRRLDTTPAADDASAGSIRDTSRPVEGISSSKTG